MVKRYALGQAPVLPTKVKLARKNLPGTNTLAYLFVASFWQRNFFITQSAGRDPDSAESLFFDKTAVFLIADQIQTFLHFFSKNVSQSVFTVILHLRVRSKFLQCEHHLVLHSMPLSRNVCHCQTLQLIGSIFKSMHRSNIFLSAPAIDKREQIDCSLAWPT